MNKIRSVALLLLMLLLGGEAARAQSVAPAMQRKKFGTLVAGTTDNYKVLSAVALNAAAGTRTATFPVIGFSKLTVWVDFTYAAATTVVATCTSSPNGGTTYGSLTSTNIASGAGTVSPYVDTYTTGGVSAIITLEYDVRTIDRLKCVFSGASGGASDLITVYATAAVGQ